MVAAGRVDRMPPAPSVAQPDVHSLPWPNLWESRPESSSLYGCQLTCHEGLVATLARSHPISQMQKRRPSENDLEVCTQATASANYCGLHFQDGCGCQRTEPRRTPLQLACSLYANGPKCLQTMFSLKWVKWSLLRACFCC